MIYKKGSDMGNYLSSVVDVLDTGKLLRIYANENDTEPIFYGRVYEIYFTKLLEEEHKVKNFKVCMSTVEIVID